MSGIPTKDGVSKAVIAEANARARLQVEAQAGAGLFETAFPIRPSRLAPPSLGAAKSAPPEIAGTY